jgi:hypothetical protein
MSDFIIKDGVLKKYTGSDSVVTVPDGVTDIDRDAFKNCTSLKEITIPNSVQSIGDWAFEGCTNLEITIPKTVKTIGTDAFTGCKKVTYLD